MKNKVIIPDFYGIFEVKSFSKDRIRVQIEKLRQNREEAELLKANLKKIEAIKNFKIIHSLGSLTVEFDDSQIEPQFMLGIILKLLNLDELIFKKRNGKLKYIFNNILNFADINIYNKTKGLLDTRSLAATILLIYGIKKIKTSPALPMGATLIWWAYNLLTKDFKGCD